MAEVYIDNQVPNGGKIVTLKRTNNGTVIGVYKFENLTPGNPGKVVERPDELGNETNGWVLLQAARTGSGVCQIPAASSQIPKIGDWFEETFDGSSAGAAERWVLTDVGPAFVMGEYLKANVSIHYSANPPATS